MTTWVYSFKEGAGKSKQTLGGKGAGLAEMTKIGLPVSPGFVITTQTCLTYLEKNKFPQGMWQQVLAKLAQIEKETGKGFGDPVNPLLVSVRSGAAISMPGMMDTVLNLGLNQDTLRGLIKKTGNERFAYDAYRRFIQMFANIVMAISLDKFEAYLDQERTRLKIKDDTQFSAQDLKKIISQYFTIYRKETGQDFPQEPLSQLKSAVKAVFDSWNNKRAIDYRNFNKIPHSLGTAVTVQTMVFGNRGETSGTGVAFTRTPATGEKKLYGEFLINAQGEDVVAGIRTPKPIQELKKVWPKIFAQISKVAQTLEKHYRDTQDLEFTVEEEKLWLLQTRTGKRTAEAAVNIAYDMVQEKLINQEEALARIEPEQISQLLHTQIDPQAKIDVITRGLAASPGAATGAVVFSADEAEKRGKAGEKVVLVRPETSPDDVHGVLQAQGVLTARGGMTSHAAVVARGLGKPCVSGCEDITINLAKKFLITKKGRKVGQNQIITINGSTGEVIAGEAPMIEPKISRKMNTILRWADKAARLSVFANADYPRDAKKAREFGAVGVGLCRTEHMFMEQERLPFVQAMILADNEEERKEPLAKIGQFQKKDFIGIFQAMAGFPVIIRLIDPPLHEFLPDEEEIKKKIAASKTKKDKEHWQKMFLALGKMHEANPMLGLRGCRLGIVMPDIIRMQTKAIIEAALTVKKQNQKVKFKIMVPLVGNLEELKFVKREILAAAEEIFKRKGERINFQVGTMIELPRAALVADQIAQEAEFFSFGTNDLTQTTLGISRDDAEGKFLAFYENIGIIKVSPFKTLDRDGVGQLVKLGIEKGRKTRKDLSIGICGEHGGDPDSIHFCHQIGLNYVSCSPYRVPVARMAAAQAAIEEGQRK